MLELCRDCEDDQSLLPSIESFQKRLDLPKVYYVFYDYFYRAVIGEADWKNKIESKKRLGTNITEAFTHALIKNNYFAWLFEYRCKNKGTKLRTEYDIDAADDDLAPDGKLFCGHLGGVVLAMPEDDENMFPIILLDGEDDERANETELREQASWTIHNKRSYEKLEVLQKEYEDSVSENRDNSRMSAKKKRKHMRDLKFFTGDNNTKDDEQDTTRRQGDPTRRQGTKTRKEKGWSREGQKFIEVMKDMILADVESGRHAKWEKTYMTLFEEREKANKVMAQQERDSEMEEFEMDYDSMYAEV